MKLTIIISCHLAKIKESSMMRTRNWTKQRKTQSGQPFSKRMKRTRKKLTLLIYTKNPKRKSLTLISANNISYSIKNNQSESRSQRLF
jgi:hypothetical protein